MRIDSALAHDAENDVRLRKLPIWIVLQALTSGVIALDSQAAFSLLLPHPNQPHAMPGCERDIGSAAACQLQFSGSHISVGCGRGERFFTPGPEQINTTVGRLLREINDLVCVPPVHLYRIPDIRSEQCRRE